MIVYQPQLDVLERNELKARAAAAVVVAEVGERVNLHLALGVSFEEGQGP